MVLIESLPTDLRSLIDGAEWQENRIGCSGVPVFRVEGHGYLKIAADHHDLRPERDRLVWLEGRLPLPVPRLLYFGEEDKRQFMLISAVPGLPAHDEHFKERPRRIVTLMAEGLLMIHRLDITGCPFDQRIDKLVAVAYDNFINHRVDENDFDDLHWGRTALDLYDELIATRPAEHGKSVLAHGDYCLPNILIDPENVTLNGFIDWGGAGISDPYYDLALAARSITFNLGAEWVQPFFDAYGLRKVDQARIAFFQLLDEFF